MLAQRRALGLRQLDVCDLAGVGPAFLYELELGKPTVRLDKVLAVLTALGLELHVRAGHGGVTVAREVVPDVAGRPLRDASGELGADA